MHKLNILKDVKPVKQHQQRTKPKIMKKIEKEVQIMKKIEKEVQKLRDVKFIQEEQHPDWLANIFPFTKKNGQIRVCIDFLDLNKACPKDDFRLPIPEIMIDNTFGYKRMSLMEGFSRYNQIKMSSEDEKHTSFRSSFGIYCYTICLLALRMQEPHMNE